MIPPVAPPVGRGEAAWTRAEAAEMARRPTGRAANEGAPGARRTLLRAPLFKVYLSETTTNTRASRCLTKGLPKAYQSGNERGIFAASSLCWVFYLMSAKLNNNNNNNLTPKRKRERE